MKNLLTFKIIKRILLFLLFFFLLFLILWGIRKRGKGNPAGNGTTAFTEHAEEPGTTGGNQGTGIGGSGENTEAGKASASDSGEAGANGESGAGGAEGTGTGSGTENGGFTQEDLLEQTANIRRGLRPWEWTPERKRRRQKRNQSAKETGVQAEEAKVIRPVHKDQVYIATDLHYYSASMTDYGKAFQDMLDRDDGKDIPDIEKILDSWIDTVLEERPATVILSGDLTLNGESIGARELSGKLKRLTDDGIQVLVIPGNHDINDNLAAVYRGDWSGNYGEDPSYATSPDAAEFKEIYRAYGYAEATESDAASLSYLYKIDEKHWLMMLDSAVYDPQNEVYGTIRPDTLIWMKKILDEAKEAGAAVLPVSHQNLLNESSYFTSDCTLTNAPEVVKLVEAYQLPLWLSGHLHLQRTRKYLPEPGADRKAYHISEMVTSSFAMYPFHYGKLTWDADGNLSYRSAEVKVSDEVRKNGLKLFKSVITEQAKENTGVIPDYMKDVMGDAYAEVMKDYVAGIPVNEKEFRSGEAYGLFNRFMDGTREFKKLNAMLKDSREDENSWSESAEAEKTSAGT